MDNETIFADLLDEPDSDPTARGIVQCLRMLAEEAASLRMAHTLAALEAAITVCAAEGDAEDNEATTLPQRPVLVGNWLH